MSLDELDSNILPPHEFVARSVAHRFPLSTLTSRESQSIQIFDIYFQDKLLLTLDKKGAKYLFPTRRKRSVKWEKITTAGLPRVIDYILRDLAQADYEVLSNTQKQILKKPIHISRYMRCPECRESGAIRIILRAESLAAEDSQIYTPISRSIDTNGAEIKCTSCGWIGLRGQLLQKVRRQLKKESGG